MFKEATRDYIKLMKLQMKAISKNDKNKEAIYEAQLNIFNKYVPVDTKKVTKEYFKLTWGKMRKKKDG